MSGYPLQNGYNRFVLFVVIGKTEKYLDYLMINNGLTLIIKTVGHHSTKREIVFAKEKVVVTIIELTK